MKKFFLIIFIFISILTFFFLKNYKKITFKLPINIIPTKSIPCTMDAKICPDGTAVLRIPPNCQFAPCPEITKKQIFCGGIANIKCPKGYYCKINDNYPDAGGTCIKEKNIKYSCPKGNYIDCMPGPDKLKSNCNQEYLNWVKENCPNFKGVVY